MTTEETARRRVCPNCSTISETPGEFCPHCGASFQRKGSQRTSQRFRRNAIIASLVILLLAGAALGALFATGILPPRLTKAEYEERMQPLFASANRETGQQAEDIQPEKSPQRAIRGTQAQANTVNRLVEKFEGIHPPREVDDEHEDMVDAYRDYAETAKRFGDNVEWARSDSGQQALFNAGDRAGAAEGRIRDSGYDIGTPYF